MDENQIKIVSNFKINDEQKKAYIAKVLERVSNNNIHEDDIAEIHLTESNNMVDVEIIPKNETEIPSFDRIRRITGYLSKVTRWNDSKRAELKDRVKHA